MIAITNRRAAEHDLLVHLESCLSCHERVFHFCSTGTALMVAVGEATAVERITERLSKR